MKEVLSLFAFGFGALCFAVFVAVFGPNAISAVSGRSQLEYCNAGAAPAQGCPPHAFTAASAGVAGCGSHKLDSIWLGEVSCPPRLILASSECGGAGIPSPLSSAGINH
jgi:hypothetical protein